MESSKLTYLGRSAALFLFCLAGAFLARAAAPGKSPDQVVAAYVRAIGGSTALDRIETREVHAKKHRGSKLVYYWQKPNKVLLVDGKKKLGYDGGSGWMVSSKKRVSKLPKGSETSLEIVANPLRFAHLKELYPEVQAANPETLDGRKMDVLVAPNNLGATKLYFDETSHLLARVEEAGETSAYFKQVTDFSEYQEVDRIKLPFRIVHDSSEPGAKPEDLRISEVTQNVPIAPRFFNKPTSAAVVLGGKR